MTKTPLTLFGLAALAGLAACLPLVRACPPPYCPPTPAYVPPCYPPTPVFVQPFDPIDLFVFVPPLAVQSPATGGAAPTTPAAPAAPAAQTAQPDDVPAGMPHARPVAGGATAAPTVDLLQVAAALTSCTACHTAPSGKSGVNIFDAAGRFAPRVGARAISDAVQTDSMPLRGLKLTAAQKKVVAAWAAQQK